MWVRYDDVKALLKKQKPVSYMDVKVPDRIGVREVLPSGTNPDKRDITTREYYAAHAPDAPEWFEHYAKEYLSVQHARNAQGQLNAINRFFQWRWYYADQMVKYGSQDS